MAELSKSLRKCLSVAISFVVYSKPITKKHIAGMLLFVASVWLESSGHQVQKADEGSPNRALFRKFKAFLGYAFVGLGMALVLIAWFDVCTLFAALLCFCSMVVELQVLLCNM